MPQRVVDSDLAAFAWRDGQGPRGGEARKAWTQSEAPDDKIRLLNPGEDNPDNLFVMRYTLKDMKSTRPRHFARIILDEAQAAKKEEGKFVNYLRMESFSAIHFVSATPVMNTPRDLSNMLEIMWKCGKLQKVFEHIPMPTTLDIYAPGYDPVGPGGFLHPFVGKKKPHEVVKFMEGMNWAEEIPVWVLNPEWYRSYGDRMEYGDEFCSVVVSRVLEVLQRRRTMTTPLRLPDNTVTFPGAGIPEMRVTMEEVSFVGEAAREVAEFSEKVKGFAGGPAGEGGFTQASGGEVRANPGQVALDHAGYRQGSLVSFNLRDKLMLERGDDGLRNPTEAAAAHLAEGLDQAERADARGGGTALTDVPMASVGFVNLIVDEDTDGGLSHMYRLTTKEPHGSPPTNRADMAYFTLSLSPTMIRVAQLCTKWVHDEGERVFILTDIPWAQQ